MDETLKGINTSTSGMKKSEKTHAHSGLLSKTLGPLCLDSGRADITLLGVAACGSFEDAYLKRLAQNL